MLSGDAKQVPEIAAGGLFAALASHPPTIELKDNRRQRHEWEVQALRQLRDGDASKALEAYLDHGRITVGHDAHDTKTLLVGDWWAAVVRGDDAIMLAGRRADVAELNMCGHVRADAAGMLSGPVLDIGGMPIQAGDRVMTLRNDRRLGVRNGNRGEVVEVDPGQSTIRVRLTRGVVDLPAEYVDAGHVGLGYAMTVNKAQGTTCDATMMLADDLLYRELAYVAMSRGRKDDRIYMSHTTMAELDLQHEDDPHVPAASTQDPIDILAAGFARRRNKQLALDSISTVPLAAWSTDDLVAERSRVRAVLGAAPPDRIADLRALGESRREVASAIGDQAESLAALRSRRRPRRQRRQPDYELTAAEANLGYYQRQVERLDLEIAALHASQHDARATLPNTAPTPRSWPTSTKSSPSGSVSRPATSCWTRPTTSTSSSAHARTIPPPTVLGCVRWRRSRSTDSTRESAMAGLPSASTPRRTTAKRSMRGTAFAARSPTPAPPSVWSTSRISACAGDRKAHHWRSVCDGDSRCSVSIMNARAEQLRSELFALPESERAGLIIDLLDSLDDRPVEEDAAELERVWAEEIARRGAQIDSGAVKTDSWDDLMEKVAQARRTA